MTDFKTRLRGPAPLIGCVLGIHYPDVAEILALAGFDYLWIDLEHGPGDFAQAQGMIQAAGGRCPCVIRVPENRDALIKKALDVGADGVVVPQVNSAEEARRAVAACHYPPEGTRGAGVARAHDYGMALADYLGRANRTTAVILQIEHVAALEHLDEILAVPGIDCLFVGPLDLSGSLGVLGQMAHPQVQEAIETVVTRAAAAEMPLGLFVGNGKAARDAAGRGFRFLAMSTDAIYLWTAARAALAEARGEA
jgi:2-dehydro-3-deoxyglucarate aldolase/4-hydroxy-2-oxoheptanedioate aldolase